MTENELSERVKNILSKEFESVQKVEFEERDNFGGDTFYLGFSGDDFESLNDFALDVLVNEIIPNDAEFHNEQEKEEFFEQVGVWPSVREIDEEDNDYEDIKNADEYDVILRFSVQHS